MSLGDGLDLDRITATSQDGVLTLTIPVAEKAKPRRITIAPGSRSDAAERPTAPTPTLTSS
ncbi:hypothetical protein BJ973_000342 [Actinoplanes tereljensis]|uniref:SHSP domain-containing protein n=1 Tax=Paractinoplanes tereljensis TaxID=571912 RepID=A0A919TUX6_9ACTN|nr:hypothetical protein Ate02nite_60310 [Actinoplanes tereljensis]